MQCLALFCMFLTVMAKYTLPTIATIPPAPHLSLYPKVVVLSFGGVRANFFDINYWLYTLRDLKSRFATPVYLEPVFPPKTPVNHWSIATGLYADGHGVIDDCRYDEKSPNTCNYEKYDEDLNPLWIDNEIHGGTSGVISWQGSEKKYKGRSPTYYRGKKENEKIISNHSHLNTMIDWLVHDTKPANLVMAYFSTLDDASHAHGAKSDQAGVEIKSMDNLVKTFVEKLIEKGIRKYVDLIILGTQGTYPGKFNKGIHLKPILNDLASHIPMGANAVVTPTKGKLQEVCKLLVNQSKNQRYLVFQQNEIPKEWHLPLDLFENKLFLVANPGYFFWNDYLDSALENQRSKIPGFIDASDFEVAFDGYSNDVEEMRTFFMAVGPSFQLRKEVSPFQTIDIYPLLRGLLGLTGHISNRQSPTTMNETVKALLKPRRINDYNLMIITNPNVFTPLKPAPPLVYEADDEQLDELLKSPSSDPPTPKMVRVDPRNPVSRQRETRINGLEKENMSRRRESAQINDLGEEYKPRLRENAQKKKMPSNLTPHQKRIIKPSLQVHKTSKLMENVIQDPSMGHLIQKRLIPGTGTKPKRTGSRTGTFIQFNKVPEPNRDF